MRNSMKRCVQHTFFLFETPGLHLQCKFGDFQRAIKSTLDQSILDQSTLDQSTLDQSLKDPSLKDPSADIDAVVASVFLVLTISLHGL